MSWFAGLLDETLNTEMELHRGYCAQFGISREELEATRPAPTTVAYTSYLLRVASQGSFGELAALAAALPVGLLGDWRAPGPKGRPGPRARCTPSGVGCIRPASSETWRSTCGR